MTHTPGLLEPLGPGLARLLAPNPSPFTGEGTWVHLIGDDRLVVLDRGVVVEEGSHDALMAVEGAYHRLYEAQARNVDRDPDDKDD